MKIANLALTFVLELAMLVALAVWGFTVGCGIAVHVLLGIGVPVAYAAAWGVCAAPKSQRQLHGPLRAVFEVAWFGSALVLLAVAGHVIWAAVLAVLCLVNQSLAYVWKQ